MKTQPKQSNKDLRSFAPISATGVTRLILGSMPGAASLQAAEYYAHPRNAFWPIAESLFGIARTSPYAERLQGLESAGIALWDVLRECRRRTSLDSDIEPDSIVLNDFSAFLGSHPRITRIYFNGNAARQLYERHVLAGLPIQQQQLQRIALPSTSPANARLSLQQKIQAWSVINQL